MHPCACSPLSSTYYLVSTERLMTSQRLYFLICKERFTVGCSHLYRVVVRI